MKKPSSKSASLMLAAIFLISLGLNRFFQAVLTDLHLREDIIVPLVLGLFLSSFPRMSTGKLKSTASWVFPLIGLFSVLVLLNAVFRNYNHKYDYINWLTRLSLYCGVPAMFLLSRPNFEELDNRFNSLINLIVLIAILLITYRLFEYSLGFGISNLGPARHKLSLVDPLRISLGTGNNTILDGRVVGFLVVTILLVVPWSLYQRLLLSIIPILYLFMIGNRQSFAGIIGVVLLIVPFRHKVFAGSASAIVALIAHTLDSWIGLGSRVLHGGDAGRFSIMAHYPSAIAEASLFGYGYGAFTAQLSGGHYAHNVFIELVYEFGLLAFFCSAFLLILFAVSFVRRRRVVQDTTLGSYLTVGVLYYLIVAQFSGTLYDNLQVFAFLIAYMSFFAGSVETVFSRRNQI